MTRGSLALRFTLLALSGFALAGATVPDADGPLAVGVFAWWLLPAGIEGPHPYGVDSIGWWSLRLAQYGLSGFSLGVGAVTFWAARRRPRTIDLESRVTLSLPLLWPLALIGMGYVSWDQPWEVNAKIVAGIPWFLLALIPLGVYVLLRSKGHRGVAASTLLWWSGMTLVCWTPVHSALD